MDFMFSCALSKLQARQAAFPIKMPVQTFRPAQANCSIMVLSELVEIVKISRTYL